MRLFRPEFCVGVAVLLSFLSLTILMLSSAPNSNREAAATGIARSLQVRTWERDLQAVASSPALLALDSRLESMERHLQELRGPSYAYPQYPAYGPPAMGASQGQMDALVQQMREAFAKSTKENQVAPQHQDYWGGWEEPTTTTPVWQGQIKELREAVERLSHQTDDRFSSLMQPGKAKGDAAKVFDLSTFLLSAGYPKLPMAPKTFDQVLKRRQAPATLAGLCFYGLVTAMFLRSQFLVDHLQSYEDGLSNLDDALTLLGGRWHLDFIREATSWPFGALDIRMNRDLLRRWLNATSPASPDPPAFQSSPFSGTREPRPALVSPTLSWRRVALQGWHQSRSLGVVVFGVHSTLVLEPATMLKAALRFWQLQVRIFMRDCPRGNEAWAHHCLLQCQALGECAPSSEGDNPSMFGHACRSPPCSRDPKSCKGNGNCCADLMFEMLVDFSNFLRRNNVTFMLSEGTLLGAVRDQDIIPYTADLDIFVPREGWEKAMLINEEPPGSKSYHFMVDPDQPHCARLCAVWQGYPANRAPFDEHFQWDTERVGNDLAYYMDIYDEDMDFAQAMKHLVYPPSTVMIRNVSFPAPREQEIYVEARYGPSWRVPDHQAREIAEKYPTLEEAKAWSMNMLMLHAAQKDATIGFRLLERASVDYKSGDIVIRGLSQGHPQETAKNLVLEEFQMEDRKVKGGKVTVYPPERDESQILDYVLYWAKEEVSSWSDEILIRRIDSGLDSLEDAPAPKERDEGNEWYRPEPEPRPLGRIWRCKGVEDPFKSCSTRGVPLQVSIPHDIQVPSDATHLAVAAENEVGESQKLTAVNLNGDQEGDGFSTRVFFSILKGFEAQNCATGGHQLEKEGWEQIVALMVLRTNSGMKEALTKLAEWLAPVSEILEDCQAETVKQRFSAALSRLKTGEMHYKPGQALAVDGISIFSHLNSAIQTYRNTRQSFSNFGTELGTLLSRLAPEVSTSEEPESSSSRSGLKLRGTGSTDMTDITGATAE